MERATRATLTQIPFFVRNFKPFISSSSHATLESGVYSVFSYAEKIAEIDTRTEKVIFFNDEFYSKTTSKIQNIIKGAFNVK